MGRHLFFSQEMKFELFFLALLFVPLIAIMGPKVTTYEYPFIARLHRCTGSLVADDLILTAYHCFYGNNPSIEEPCGTATFNDADPNVKEEGEVTYKMRFVKNYTHSDLALAKLEKKVTGIKPVKISNKQVNPGDSVTAVGFGRNGLVGSPDHNDGHLRHVDLQV